MRYCTACRGVINSQEKSITCKGCSKAIHQKCLNSSLYYKVLLSLQNEMPNNLLNDTESNGQKPKKIKTQFKCFTCLNKITKNNKNSCVFCGNKSGFFCPITLTNDVNEICVQEDNSFLSDQIVKNDTEEIDCCGELNLKTIKDALNESQDLSKRDYDSFVTNQNGNFNTSLLERVKNYFVNEEMCNLICIKCVYLSKLYDKQFLVFDNYSLRYVGNQTFFDSISKNTCTKCCKSTATKCINCNNETLHYKCQNKSNNYFRDDLVCSACDKKDKEVIASVKLKPVIQNVIANNMSQRRNISKNGTKNGIEAGDQNIDIENNNDDAQSRSSMKEEQIDSGSRTNEPSKSKKKVQVDNQVNFYSTVAPDVLIYIIDKLIILENSHGLQLLGEFNEPNLEISETKDEDKMDMEDKILNSYVTSSVLNPEEINNLFGVPGITKIDQETNAEKTLDNFIKEQSELNNNPNAIQDELQTDKNDTQILETNTESKNLDMQNCEQEESIISEKILQSNVSNLKRISSEQKLLEKEQLYETNFARCLEKQRFKDPERSYKVYPKISSHNFRKRAAVFDFREKTKINEKDEPNTDYTDEEPTTKNQHLNPPIKNDSFKKYYTEESLEKLIPSYNTDTIFDIREACCNNEFVYTIDQLVNINNLLNNSLRQRCKSVMEKCILGSMIHKAYIEFKDKCKVFSYAKHLDLNSQLDIDQAFMIKSSEYPRIPKCYRDYHTITDYEPVELMHPKMKPKLMERMKSGKFTTKCDENCECKTKDISELGEFSLLTLTWNSNCPCRKAKIECSDMCGCSSCNCANMQVTNNEIQELGKDVDANTCWGFDFYTRKNLFCVQSDNISSDEKNSFLDQQIKVLNTLQFEGWNIIEACNKLIDEFLKETDFSRKMKLTQSDAIQARIVMQHLMLEWGRKGYRVYSKGLGIIASNSIGIKKNHLIVQYYGEVYPAWYWYDKQDTIKMFLIQAKKGAKGYESFRKYINENSVPDFYNIMLEKHKSDPQGYDILFVDPTFKGEFGSRFSHSCVPNCGTISTVSNGKYTIGMYALRDIGYGEELTFDYCSMTENEKEFRNSICLCGNMNCKGYYLGFCKKHTQVFPANRCKEIQLDTQSECFLDANAAIMQSGLTPLTESDEKSLDEACIRESLLKDCPMWLKKWTAITLKKINKEKEELQSIKESLLEGINDEERRKNKHLHYTLEINNLYEARINMLAISQDKLKGFLEESLEKWGGLSALSNKENKSFSDKKKSEPHLHNGDIQHSKTTNNPYLFNTMISPEKNPKENKPQNNLNTIGKCKFLLPENPSRDSNKPDLTCPPLYLQSTKQFLNYLWGENPSIRKIVLTMLNELKHSSIINDQTPMENILLMDHIIKILSNNNIQKAFAYIKEVMEFDLKNDYNWLEISPEEHENIKQTSFCEFSGYTQNEVSLIRVRQILIFVSVLIKKLNMHPYIHPGLSDILYFIAMSSFLCAIQSYPSFIRDMKIRECDLTNSAKYMTNNQCGLAQEGKIVKTDKKKFSSNFVWAQLVYWLKQTIDKPDASLSAGRRGTMTLPELNNTFFRSPPNDSRINTKNAKKNIKLLNNENHTEPNVNFNNQSEINNESEYIKPQRVSKKAIKIDGNTFSEIESDYEETPNEGVPKQKRSKSGASIKWPYNDRQKWLQRLIERPSDQWPLGDNWSYDNKMKIYGSFLMDSVILKDVWPTFRQEIIENLSEKLVDGQLIEKTNLKAKFELLNKLTEKTDEFWQILSDKV